MIIFKEDWEDSFSGFDPDGFGSSFDFGEPAIRDERDPSEFETPKLTKFNKNHIDKFGPELHPDRTYIEDFHSITFIYDTKTGDFYQANYPQTHADIVNKDNQKIGKKLGLKGAFLTRKEMIPKKHILLGRIGILDSHRTDPYGKGARLLYKSIGFWNNKITQKSLNQCLQTLVDKFPELDQERERVVVFSAYGHAFPNFWLSEAKINFKQKAVKKSVKANKISPQCTKLSKLNVGGKNLTLAQILSNLHMVKGNDLSQMSSSFCTAAPNMKKSLQDQGCSQQVDMVDTIWNKLGCKDDRNQIHQQALAHGWQQRADDFKRSFQTGTIDQSPRLPTFHTQKDINRAWELANKKRPLSFEWFLQNKFYENLDDIEGLLDKFPEKDEDKAAKNLQFVKEKPRAHPDNLYRDGSITFIYDPVSKKLYHAMFPTTHKELLNNDYSRSNSKEMGVNKVNYSSMDDGTDSPGRGSGLRAGKILGRIGWIFNYDYDKGMKKIPAIGVWNKDISKSQMDECLQSIVREFPNLDINNTVVFSSKHQSFEAYLLKDANIQFSQGNNSGLKSNGDKPECLNLAKINVAGKDMTLTQILGNLHMVKGNDLAQMKVAFCASAKKLKQELLQKGCQYSANLIDDIWNKLKCNDDYHNIYNQSLKAGKDIYKQDLQRDFRTGNIDQSNRLPTFHTQKDINRAWSLANKREGRIPTFIEWLQNEKK